MSLVLGINFYILHAQLMQNIYFTSIDSITLLYWTKHLVTGNFSSNLKMLLRVIFQRSKNRINYVVKYALFMKYRK